MGRVAGASNDGEAWDPAAYARCKLCDENGVIHCQHEGGSVTEMQFVGKFCSPDVAEQHVIIEFPRFANGVDVAVDRKIGPIMRNQHVGDHPTDAAETEDNGSVPC